jgi:hypothetical protein
MRSLINLRIKSKLNFTIHKLNEEITLSNINCDKKKKKKKLSQKNINEEKKYNWLTLMFIADDHSIFITIIGI